MSLGPGKLVDLRAGTAAKKGATVIKETPMGPEESPMSGGRAMVAEEFLPEDQNPEE